MNSADARSRDKKNLTIEQAVGLAVQHQTAGRLREAASIYEQVLRGKPDQPDALRLLGLIARQKGDNDRAVDLISRAMPTGRTMRRPITIWAVRCRALADPKKP